MIRPKQSSENLAAPPEGAISNPTEDIDSAGPLLRPHQALGLSSDRIDVEQVLAGGGEMGALMRAMDWRATALGPTSGWSQSLRTTVSTCLNSRFPILVWWGPELVKIYNDAYRPMLGAKHPRSMGARGRDVWPEIWHIIGPMLEGVLADGTATWSENQLLLLERHGYPEECYFTFSYSPIRVETGDIGGIYCAVTETTRQILSERRLRTLGDMADRASRARSAEEVCTGAALALSEDAADVPFALLYLVEPGEREARLAACAGIEPGERASPRRLRLDLNDEWPVARALDATDALVVADVERRFGPVHLSHSGPSPGVALVVPVVLPGETAPRALVVTGISPRLALDAEYENFLKLAAGNVATALGSVRALEDAERRVQALAELDRAKTAFFGNVSHEFRTPLTLMLGPTEDLLNGTHGELSPALRRELELIRRNGGRLQRLVTALLDFSRIEAGRMQACFEPTDVGELTRDLASSFRSAVERAGLYLDVDCPSATGSVHVDRRMWEQIVLNLLSNAFKFTFEGGIGVRLVAGEDSVELSVADTGVGVAPADLPRLFERFHRVEGVRARTHEGSGIGLALVQELVRLHGGTVDVSSVVGAGTTFRVTLPRGSAHLPPDRVRAPEAERRGLGGAAFVEEASRWLPDVPSAHASRSGRILVVDDNADMRDYLRRLLEPHWPVEVVENGDRALAAALADPPDLVLTDVMMPGLDGFALLAELRRNVATREVPVVMLSARAGEEAKIEGLSAGVEDYLVKPFSARELLARVRMQLELGRLRAEARARHEELYSLFLQAPVPICVLAGPDLVFEMANDRCRQVARRSDLVGQKLLDAVPELRGQGFDQLLLDVMKTGQSSVGGETLVRLETGSGGRLEEIYLTFVFAPLENAEGVTNRVMVCCNEVTDQVLARRKIEESEARFRAIFEGARVSIWDLDFSEVEQRLAAWDRSRLLTEDPALVDQLIAAIRIRDVNPATLRLFGATGPEVLSFATERICLPESRPAFAELFGAFAERRSGFSCECSLGTLGGRRFDVLMSAGFAPQDRVLLTLIDVSARKLVEREREAHAADLERAVRFSELFVGMLGHDLRNPLSAITTAANLLELRAESERIAKPVGRILASADRMDRMIAQLLDFTRIRLGRGLPLERTSVNLAEICRAVTDEIGPVRLCEIQLHADGDVGGSWDGDRLFQLVSNLVANACQHGPSGGPVSIRLDGTAPERVRLSVENRGTIPPELLPLLFEPLHQSGERREGSSGLGLGLYITKQIALAHGGTVQVESDERQGTRFVVELPRRSKSGPEALFGERRSEAP